MKSKKNRDAAKTRKHRSPVQKTAGKSIASKLEANAENRVEEKKLKPDLQIDNIIVKAAMPLIVLLAAAVYGQTLGYGLVHCDDNGIFAHFNYYANINNIRNAFLEGYYGSEYYRPMVTSSFIIDAQLGGREHFVNHLTNLILHIGTAAGIFYLLLLVRFKKAYALAAALLFTVHPVFTNAAAWLNGRNDLLVGIFAVWSFYFFILFRKNKNPLFFVVSCVLYLFAGFSKEVGLVLPAAIAVWILIVEKDRFFTLRNLMVFAGYAVAAFLWIYLRSLADIGVPQEMSGLDPLIVNLRQIPEFISKFFVPYNIEGIPSFHTGSLILGLLFTGILTAAAFAVKEKNTKMLIFGAFWFLLFLIPGLFKRMNNAAEFFDYLECRSYLPMIGMLFILGSLIPKKIQSLRNKYFTGVSALIIIIFGAVTFFEAKDYKSPVAFWEQAVRDNPGRVVNLRQLGMEYQNIDRQDEAEKLFLRALSLNPKYEVDFLYVHLGLVHISREDYAKAAEMFEMARQADPSSKLARKNLANALIELGRYKEAIEPLLEMRQIDPSDPLPLSLLAKAYSNTGDYKQAAEYASMLPAEKSRTVLDPIYTQWSTGLFKQGKFEEAIQILKMQIENDPGNHLAYNNLGIAYVQIGKYDEAEENWKKCIKLKPDNMEAQNNLIRLYLFNKNDVNAAVKRARVIMNEGGSIDPALMQALRQYL